MTVNGHWAGPGDWVMIHRVVLPPGERAPAVPEDTRKVPLEMFVRGFIQSQARVGEECTVVTATGRKVAGVLREIFPRYPHDFGRPVPEMLTIGPELRRLIGRRQSDAEPGRPEGREGHGQQPRGG